MITVWVLTGELDIFIRTLENISHREEGSVSLNYYTYPPKNPIKFNQLLIGYDEYAQLRDKNKRG